MYTLEFYKDMEKERVYEFSSIPEAEKCAHSILDNVQEYFDSYCMIWEGKSMISYITSKNF